MSWEMSEMMDCITDFLKAMDECLDKFVNAFKDYDITKRKLQKQQNISNKIRNYNSNYEYVR
jgi:hypothetical protein